MILKKGSRIILMALSVCLLLGSMTVPRSVNGSPFLIPEILPVDVENHNFFEQEAEEDLFGSLHYPRKMEVRVISRSASIIVDPPAIFLAPIPPPPIDLKRPG